MPIFAKQLNYPGMITRAVSGRCTKTTIAKNLKRGLGRDMSSLHQSVLITSEMSLRELLQMWKKQYPGLVKLCVEH